MFPVGTCTWVRSGSIPRSAPVHAALQGSRMIPFLVQPLFKSFATPDPGPANPSNAVLFFFLLLLLLQTCHNGGVFLFFLGFLSFLDLPFLQGEQSQRFGSLRRRSSPSLPCPVLALIPRILKSDPAPLYAPYISPSSRLFPTHPPSTCPYILFVSTPT